MSDEVLVALILGLTGSGGIGGILTAVLSCRFKKIERALSCEEDESRVIAARLGRIESEIEALKQAVRTGEHRDPESPGECG